MFATTGKKRGAARLAAGALGAAATLGLGVAPAFAHDAVIESSPAAGETVAEFPKEISLTFSGVPKDQFNSFAVSEVGEDGKPEKLFDTDEPELDGQTFTIPVPDDVEAGAGDYVIGYNITSSDGHATPGSVEFSVAGEGEEAHAPEAAADEDEGVPTAAIVGIVIGVIAAIAVAAAIVVFARRNKNA